MEEKEKHLSEWMMLRGKYFNILDEDRNKFDKLHKNHYLYTSVIKHFDKSFKEINQIAHQEIDAFLKENKKG